VAEKEVLAQPTRLKTFGAVAVSAALMLSGCE